MSRNANFRKSAKPHPQFLCKNNTKDEQLMVLFLQAAAVNQDDLTKKAETLNAKRKKTWRKTYFMHWECYSLLIKLHNFDVFCSFVFFKRCERVHVEHVCSKNGK